MSVDGIFQMKSHLIHQRLRSRDLYDLYMLARDHGYAVSDILKVAVSIDTACSMDYAKSILLGIVPLDKDDEGLDVIGTEPPLETVFAFFQEEINKMEVETARIYAAQKMKV